MQEEVKGEEKAYMEVLCERFPPLVNHDCWSEVRQIAPEVLFLMQDGRGFRNVSGGQMEFNILPRGEILSRLSEKEAQDQFVGKRLSFPDPLLRGVGMVEDPHFQGITIATESSMHIVWIRMMLSSDLPYLMYSNLCFPGEVGLITANAMKKTRDGRSVMVLGTQDTRIFTFDPTDYEKVQTMKEKHQIVNSVKYLLQGTSRWRAGFKRVFGLNRPHEPQGAILAIDLWENLVFAVTSQKQLLCRSSNNAASWCMSIGDPGRITDCLLSSRAIKIQGRIVIGVAVQSAEHVWEIRAYSTDISGNNPNPLSEEALSIFHRVDFMMVDTRGNLVYQGIEQPQNYTIPMLYLNQTQIWTLDNEFEFQITHSPKICDEAVVSPTGVESTVPSRVLDLFLSQNHGGVLILRNEGVSMISQPGRVLQDWILRRQGRDIPFEEEYMETGSSAMELEEDKQKFEELFVAIKHEFLKVRQYDLMERPPSQVDQSEYPFIQSCLIFKYLEELLHKLDWLSSQLPYSLSRSYAQEIEEHRDKLQAFYLLLSNPVRSENLEMFPEKLQSLFDGQQPTLAYFFIYILRQEIKSTWAERIDEETVYEVGARTALGLFGKQLTAPQYLTKASKFFLEKREGFSVCAALASLTRPTRPHLDMGLNVAFKTQTDVIPWLRKLTCDEITGTEKVVKSMVLVARHAKRDEDVQNSILLLNEIGKKPKMFKVNQFQIFEMEVEIWRIRGELA